MVIAGMEASSTQGLGLPVKGTFLSTSATIEWSANEEGFMFQ
jgi:hypothetical protein